MFGQGRCLGFDSKGKKVMLQKRNDGKWWVYIVSNMRYEGPWEDESQAENHGLFYVCRD
jgi:hypothetical protein